jgi:outer membrane lipoprotein-sorting protein
VDRKNQEVKMRLARICIPLLFLSLFTLPATAQDQAKTKQIVEELTQKAKNVKSFTVDVDMQTSVMGEKVETKGTMAFKEPGKMHMSTMTEMMGGMKQEVYKSGDLVWSYMPLMKMATKINMAQVREAFPEQKGFEESDLTKTLRDIPENALTLEKEEKADGKDVYVFQVEPKEFQPDMVSPQKNFPMMPEKIEMLIYADNGLPHEIRMYGKNNQLFMDQKYTNYQLNVALPDSEFQFTPPEGTQVMDMTEATINMMKRMKEGENQAQPAPAQ